MIKKDGSCGHNYHHPWKAFFNSQGRETLNGQDYEANKVNKVLVFLKLFRLQTQG